MSAATPDPEEQCAFFDGVCKIQGVAGDAVTGVAGQGAASVIQALADAVFEGVGKIIATVGTAWTGIRTPLLTGDGNGAQVVDFLQGSLWFYTAGLAVLAVLVGGGRMAWEQRAAPGINLLKSLITLAVVGAVGVAVVGLGTYAADGFADWIIDRSTDGPGFAQNLLTLFTVALSGGPLGAGVGALLSIIFGTLAILGCIVQVMLMIARSGMIVMLAGTLPTTAAFTSTDAGDAMFRKAVAWTLAFILYKPAAAIVYATAFRLTASDLVPDDGTGALSFLVGLVMMVLALIALPALMRFIVPAVAAVAAAAGGGSAAALTTALATGAISLGGAMGGKGKGSGGGGGGGTSEGPSGSKQTSPAPTGGPSGGGGPSTSGTGGPVVTAVTTGVETAQKVASGVKQGANNATRTGEGPDGSS